MVVGPEFGPIAGLAVAIVQRRADVARRSLAALVVGFPVAIVASLVFVAALRLLDLLPETYTDRPGPSRRSSPNPTSSWPPSPC